jgi:hypothetical protein
MSLTEHIPLPDSARGPVQISRGPGSRCVLFQYAYSNHTKIAEVTDDVARIMRDELNARMAVARKLGA